MNKRIVLKTTIKLSYYQNIETLFDELSAYYNYLYPNIQSNNEHICKELNSKVLRPNKIRKILDCACGTGHMAIELAKLGYEVTASDISSGMIEKANSNAQQNRVGVKFVHSNILDLSRNINEKFDMVICRGNSFSHIKPEDFETALKTMGRVLKNGGICYVDTRDFETIIRTKPLFEHRAHFRLDSKDIVTFYLLDYKENLRRYNIFFVFLDRYTKTVSHKIIAIDGFYVFENDLINALKKSGFEEIKKIALKNESKDINIYIGKKK